MAIDVEAELRAFEWRCARWTTDKLIACSPFRDDRRPSFYVWLRDDPVSGARAGYWGDSGGYEYQRGGFVQLLAFLRNETEEETREYLRSKYGSSAYVDTENMTLDLSGWTIDPKPKRRGLDPAILDEYRFRHPYLERRGISEKVQRLMRVGYDRKHRAITIPWFLPDGTLGNIKYRRVDSKQFWYHKGGMPIRELVYGLNIIYRKEIREAVLCEAEIDAMTAMTAGIPAIAVGGAKMSEQQAELIARSPLESVILATDNDEAGEKMREQAIRRLIGYVDLKIASIPAGYKDLNELRGPLAVQRAIHSAKMYGLPASCA